MDPVTHSYAEIGHGVCDSCGLEIKKANAEAETSERSGDSSPAPRSASDERKAYNTTTTASSLVWGGEHGWERDEVGEHDLAHALRRYVLKRQNKEITGASGAVSVEKQQKEEI